MFFNFQYLLFMAPAFLLMLITTWYVKSAYQKWSRVAARSRLSGTEAAQRLIARGGSIRSPDRECGWKPYR